MPNIRKATKREKANRKARYGHKGGGRGYIHTLNRKNNEREALKPKEE